MPSIFQILPEMAVIAAVVGAIALTGLAFRNPFRPTWLRSDWTSTVASLAIAAAVCFASGYMIAGSVVAGFGVATAIVLMLAVYAVAGYAVVRGFEMGERLRRSDAGQSPFYPHPGIEAVRRALQFRTRAGA